MAKILQKTEDGTMINVPITASKTQGVLTINGETFDGSEDVEVEIAKMTTDDVDALFD